VHFFDIALTLCDSLVSSNDTVMSADRLCDSLHGRGESRAMSLEVDVGHASLGATKNVGWSEP
jgi:hypothetical protein